MRERKREQERNGGSPRQRAYLIAFGAALLLAGCNEAQHPVAEIEREKPVAVASAEAPPAPAVVPTATVSAVATATAAPTATAPEARRSGLVDTPETARRLARAVAADILLYNFPEVEKARRTKVISEKLAAEITEGKALFEHRTEPAFYGLYQPAIEEIVLQKKSGDK